MAKTKAEPQAEKKAPRTPLGAFAHHQVNALEETGKALASLLPKEFRTHAGNAIKESKTSFKALFEGAVDTLEDGLDRLRGKPKEDEAAKDKVKVEVD